MCIRDRLKRMDAGEVRVENGRVLFSGGPELLARANIGLRCAERVQILLGTFPARSFEELFQGVKALPWENWIGKSDRFPVKGWSLTVSYTHLNDGHKGADDRHPHGQFRRQVEGEKHTGCLLYTSRCV